MKILSKWFSLKRSAKRNTSLWKNCPCVRVEKVQVKGLLGRSYDYWSCSWHCPIAGRGYARMRIIIKGNKRQEISVTSKKSPNVYKSHPIWSHWLIFRKLTTWLCISFVASASKYSPVSFAFPSNWKIILLFCLASLSCTKVLIEVGFFGGTCLLRVPLILVVKAVDVLCVSTNCLPKFVA